jgi:hypothetical protein
MGVPPKQLAQPRGNIPQPIKLPPGSNLQPGEFLVSLVIDNQSGKFVTAKAIDPSIPAADKGKYEQVFNQVFQKLEFSPAAEEDGSQPGMSNLILRVRISSNQLQRQLDN